jgi:exodeoxyribonuclease VII small subunit
MNDAPTFEKALTELEEILHDLESDTTSLDNALARYERGAALLKQCYTQLKTAEQKIVQLTGVNADGTPVLEPFEHTAAVDKAKRKKADT